MGMAAILNLGSKPILALFRSPYTWMQHMKFDYIWPMVSEKKSFESVDGRRMDDGGFPYY